MSTFSGEIKEIPYISVDQFENNNFNSTIYFLSHCHWDHMRGLDDARFQELLLQRSGVYFYASHVSCQILRGIFPNIVPKLKELPLENATLIKLPNSDNKYLSVTPLPAGHCPGSVMFLFEFDDKNILYTGDYRVTASDLKKFNAFYTLGKLKKFHKMYLDTTFCKESFLSLPQRKESLDIITKIVKEWLDKGPTHIIHIKLSARYGSEYLFIELASSIGMPIHVNAQAFNLYKFVPQMDTAVTLNGDATRIHAGCGPTMKTMCSCANNKLIRTVIPSALHWEGNTFKDGIMSKQNEEYRVCYSTHSSFEEIKEFLLFLQPENIKPCVVPNNKWQKEKMKLLLRNVWKTWQDSSGQDQQIKLFDVITKGQVDGLGTSTEADEECDEVFDDISCSPPKNFKRKRVWLNSEK